VFESSEWLSMLSKRSPCPFGGEGSGGGSFSTTGQVQMNVDGFFLPVLVLTFQICFLDWRFSSLVWFEFGLQIFGPSDFEIGTIFVQIQELGSLVQNLGLISCIYITHTPQCLRLYKCKVSRTN
jgi:hypothetical protein